MLRNPRNTLLAHQSWKLKSVFRIACRQSSVCKLYTHIFILFSRTTGPIANELGTEHPYIKGDSHFSIELQHPSRREDYSKMAK